MSFISVLFSKTSMNLLFYSKWKTKEKITAILALPDRNQILTAAKSIKLWDVSTKQTVKSFTGHSYEVILLSYIAPKENSSSYFLCASKGDRLLTCWNLDATSSDTKNAVACFLMEDVCQNISIVEGEDGSTNMAVVTRSGVVHIYKHTLNGYVKFLFYFFKIYLTYYNIFFDRKKKYRSTILVIRLSFFFKF